MDVCYNDERSEVDLNGQHTVESKLPSQVQDLMKLIFDVKAMKKSLVEFELDLEKMPLGKLSHDQLKKAYGILTRLLENIKVGNYMTPMTYYMAHTIWSLQYGPYNMVPTIWPV